MASLQVNNRVLHTRADRFVPMSALKDGIVDGAAQFGLALMAVVVTQKVMTKRQECVKVVVKDKRVPDLYLTQTAMGTVPYLDMFTVGHRDLMHIAGSMALAQTVDLFRPRSVGAGGRAAVSGAIGWMGGKKIAREHAVVDDFLDVFVNDVVPYAYQYALNDGNGSGGSAAEPLPEPRVPIAEVVVCEDDERRKAAQAAKEKAAREKAQREKAAREKAEREKAERERQQREAEAAERRAREERARKERELKARLAAKTAEANVLNKLVFITREEARTGCTKTIEAEKGRWVTVTVPAGVTYDSHIEVPDEGRLDTAVGVRGILRLSFAYSD